MLRPEFDLSLYLVTDTASGGAAGVPATVAQAAAGGATIVQLRDPGASDEEFVALGRAVADRLAGSGVPLIINDRAHLVCRLGAQGVHVGQSDIDPMAARDLVGPDAILGLSVQTLDHVAAAREYPPGVIDYLGVGPVWPQTTKPDAAEPGGLSILRDIVAASPWPCVAIGGVTAERAALVRQTGAAGIAVVSAVCGDRDPRAATRRLRQAWEAGIP